MTKRDVQHLKNLTSDGNFRQKVAAILKDADGHGYRLSIGSSMRSRKEQEKKVQQGYSKTMRSKHLPGPDGLARAADIVSTRLGWNASPDYWIMVGRLALTKGLTWGGLWGLPRKMRKELEAFLTKPSTPTEPFNPYEWKGKLGWDVSHVET